jgi:WD40 repeat protein
MTTDAFGATPLPPVSVDTRKVWYNPSDVVTLGQPQQPHVQQVAAFEAVPNDDCKNGSVLDVNQHFIVYAVKNGLLRVLHRNSSVRTLLRGHVGKITDVSFFQNGDVLGTVGTNVIIWRIFYTPSLEIHAEPLLEIPSLGNTTRIVWHPFNPNQFWLLHTNSKGIQVATLVETTRITTTTTTTTTSTTEHDNDKDDHDAGQQQQQQQHHHAVCQLYKEHVVMDGAVLIATESNITDLCWSGKDTRHVMTCHENGNIRLWNVKQLLPVGDGDAAVDGHVPASCISVLTYPEPVTKCFFLPHDDIAEAEAQQQHHHHQEPGLTSAFCTASRNNSVVTLWSSFYPNQEATQLQEFGIDNDGGDYNLDLCYGQAPPDGSPPAFFLLLSNRREGQVYALHLSTIWSATAPKRALAVGLDYVTPFCIKYPIFSWSIACVPAQAVSDEEPIAMGGLNFDLRFFAYQSKMVQQYTVPHYMCAAPSTTWSTSTPGVRVESGNHKVPVHNTVELDNSESYDEEYELEEVDHDDDDDDDEYDPPSASALPTPDGLDATTTATSSTSNPFANWLGAIAAKTTSTGASGNVPPPPTPVTSSTTAVIPTDLVESTPLPSMMEPAFLKPGELLSPGSMR